MRKKQREIVLASCDRADLERIVADGNARQKIVKRARIVLMTADGSGVVAIMRAVGVSKTSVWRWQDYFAEAGVSGLVKGRSKPPGTKPIEDAIKLRIVEKTVKERPVNATQTPVGPNEIRPAARALIEILHHKPTNYGINRSNWTQASLAEAFGKVYDRRPAKGTVGRLLKEAGLSWKQSRKALTSPDPRYREKVDLLLQTLRSLTVTEDLFFIDELGPLQVRRYGGRRYELKGQTPTHPQSQKSKGSITLYGALSAITNQMTWFYATTKDSAGIIDLAEILFNQNCKRSKIYLTWDAASWHGSDALLDWVDELNSSDLIETRGPTIEFVPLPSSAQFLNVVEAVFSGMKRAVIHNSDYQSADEMKTAISTHFSERNQFFINNPKRAGNKIWEIDFFQDRDLIRSGNYRQW